MTNTTKSLNLLKPTEVAEILGVTIETLNVWRATKRYNLPYIKTGRLVRYKEEDVLNFIEERRMESIYA